MHRECFGGMLLVVDCFIIILPPVFPRSRNGMDSPNLNTLKMKNELHIVKMYNQVFFEFDSLKISLSTFYALPKKICPR